MNTVDFMQRVNNQTKAIQQGIKTLRGEVRPETVREAVKKSVFFRKEAVKKSIFFRNNTLIREDGRYS